MNLLTEMEFGGIVDALEDKSILITGSTGFLAKIFVEKVLRVQPKVKRLYLLVRASDTKSAEKRLQNEVIQKELFDLLRKQHGEEFHSFIAEKVCPVPGDIIHENLGIEDINMRELLWKEIKMVIHSAATTNFYGRYDFSLSINALGPMNVINFAKRCKKLEMFLHVSTAYVAGEKQGLLLEKAFSMGETLKDNLYLDIASEIKLLEIKKRELQLHNSGLAAEKIAMKELGIESSAFWVDKYICVTKAMGEMLLGRLRGSLPLVIARPTIITSTWKEPFPGWIEENGTIDNVILGYAKGILPCVAINSEVPIDMIPGDMVVNAMIAMAVAHSNQQAEFIYHISSSVRNPVNYAILDECMSRYFSKNPLFGEEGKAISMPNVHVFKTMAKFNAFVFLRYILPMEMLRLVNNNMLCLFPKHYSNLSQKYVYAMRIVDLFQPYCFFKKSFDDTNLERLRMATKKLAENHIFYFDPKDMDWKDYLYNTHIPSASMLQLILWATLNNFVLLLWVGRVSCKVIPWI